MDMKLGYIEDLGTHLASVENESEHKSLDIRKFMREVTNLLRDKEEMQRSVNALEGELAHTSRGPTEQPFAALRGLARPQGTSTVSVQVFENKGHDMDLSLARRFGLPQLRSRTLVEPVFSTTSVGLRTLSAFKASALLVPSPLAGTSPASPVRHLTPLSPGLSPLSRASPYSPNIFHFSLQQEQGREATSTGNSEDLDDGSSTHLDVISRTPDVGRPFGLPSLADEFTLHLPAWESSSLAISDFEEPRRDSLGSASPLSAPDRSFEGLSGGSVCSPTPLLRNHSELLVEAVKTSECLHKAGVETFDDRPQSSDMLLSPPHSEDFSPDCLAVESNATFSSTVEVEENREESTSVFRDAAADSSDSVVYPSRTALEASLCESGPSTPRRHSSTPSSVGKEEINRFPNLRTLDEELSRVSFDADSVTHVPDMRENASLSQIQIPQQDINQIAAQYSTHSSAIDVISGLAYCIFAAPPILIRNAAVASFRFVARCAKYTLIASVLSIVSVDDINEVYSSKHKVPVAA